MPEISALAEPMAHAVIAGWLLRSLWRVARSRCLLQNTTLTAAWPWTVAAIGLWLMAWASQCPWRQGNPALRDHLWYAASVCSLCPFIAVLGARRPGVAAWTWFVLLPLILVLEWPPLAAWQGTAAPASLELELPAVIPFVLVLVMGTGNYIGTRFTGAALLAALALILAVGPVSTFAANSTISSGMFRLAAAIAACTSIELVFFAAGRRSSTVCGWDRVWLDFRDWYGIVWARRLQDRWNSIAEREQWAARLEPQGIRWNPENSTEQGREKTRRELDQTFRWMLKRFVDPAWIDERLK